ncbi:amino acid adenylation domain-containing protein [Streptomyces sp. NBC_00347]|uniref:non-ribosomal peptide synthetase n=1 Tax=Streptomyces sp. NBC_00347 TaxID=2975721 RepID=UPI00224F65DD|nr:amino acid adenylation domain-containing protein [Streptomyces sp. NBC_00347]MCX5127235.1 amino acid adenylation domain-containing protein [Streptomyces sp. NBC_00347]
MTDHEPFPLTPLQEGYLVGMSDMVELGGFRPGYYVEIDLVDLDPARARQALETLVRRHGHLRVVVDGAGTQRVLPEAQTPPLPLRVTDLTGLDEDRQRAALAATRERMCEEGVDPGTWPLFEIVVQRVRERRFRAHISMSLLLLDGRGIRRVMDEWRTYYDDPAAVLPEPAATYRDSRMELLAHENSPAYREQWRYWEERLDTLPDAPRLPLAVQPAAIASVRFRRRTHHLGQEQWQRLCATFRGHRVLPTTALLHVFAEVIGAWADSPRFSLNMLHQNWASSRPHMADVVGQFGATLPLEVNLNGSDGSADFWERARNLQKQVIRDLQNADVAGVAITRALAARRGWTSRAALPYVFTSMLKPGATPAPDTATAAPRGAGSEGPVGRLACREVFSDLRTPQVLVDNQLHSGAAGGVDCVWDVVDAAFPAGLPDLMFDAYARMLDLLAGPDAATAAPDPVPAAHRALVEALNTAVSAPPEERLEDGFLRRAALDPGAVAVLSARRTLTYGELEARSRAVAAWLRSRGVGRGDVVPVVMAKGWEQIVGVLGVLRAGAAYCPVDAALPAERIGHLLDTCSAPAVLVQSHTAPASGATGSRPQLAVDEAESVSESESESESEDAYGTVGGAEAGPDAAHGGTPEDLAYIIYTSGSTGLPKGVMIEHRAAVNTIADVNERVALTPADRVFCISSLSFDLSVWDVFGALAAGSALVLPAAASRPDPVGWAETAAAFGVTVWNSVPALAQMLAEADGASGGCAKPPVRAFLMSGDWIPTTLPDLLRSRWPAVRLIAMGGATEASIWSNVHEIGEVDPAWPSIPYGVPLRNQTMRVLDHRLGLRPPWAVGRIHIGGAGLSTGYWADEERTAERFFHHPSGGERLYWTGDLGCYRPDGTIEFLGREDRQLKIQGFRVEPGEVEAAVREHPAVRECVVDGVAAPGGQRRLVALVVPYESAVLDDRTVLAHLRSRLPHYLVPGQVHVLDRLPLTPNGKVDVAGALAGIAARTPARAVDAAGAADAPEESAAGGPREALSALWTELLGIAPVGPDDNFFALGGNSLLALRLVTRIRTDLGVELPFGQVFEAPTVRALAARIGEHDLTASSRVLLSAGTGAADGVPLFLFHPVGGSVAAYTGFAQAWPGPVHAFQSRGLAEGTIRACEPDLETMARAYREELQRVRPAGPYALGGWSMGGVLAQAVAGQLAGQGHEVALFMIDSDLLEDRSPATEADRHVEFLGDLAGGRLPAEARAAVLAAPAGRLVETGAEVACANGWLPAEAGTAQYELLMRVHAHNLAVLDAHRPDKLDVPALLLLAGEVDRPDPVAAWQDLVPGIEVEVWPYDHYSIVGPEALPAVAARAAAWLGATLAARAEAVSVTQDRN